MKTPKSGEHGQHVVRKYENYGSIGGLALGLVIGVIASAPHFHDWRITTSLLVIMGCGLFIGLLGHIAIAIAYGSAVAGFGGVTTSTEDRSSDRVGIDGDDT